MGKWQQRQELLFVHSKNSTNSARKENRKEICQDLRKQESTYVWHQASITIGLCQRASLGFIDQSYQ